LFGGSNGSATASQTGGTPGYSYSWNTLPAKTTKSITGLAPGTYSCTITDTAGCTAVGGCTVNQPASALTATATSSMHHVQVAAMVLLWQQHPVGQVLTLIPGLQVDKQHKQQATYVPEIILFA